MIFSHQWGDPANQVEFASASRRTARVDERQAVELFAAAPAPVRQPRREMRIGMRVWDQEVIDGRR